MTLDQLVAELERRGFKRMAPDWYQRYVAQANFKTSKDDEEKP